MMKCKIFEIPPGTMLSVMEDKVNKWMEFPSNAPITVISFQQQFTPTGSFIITIFHK